MPSPSSRTLFFRSALVLLLGLTFQGCAEESLSVFIEQTITAAGGTPALERARTVLARGKVTSLARGREGVMARLWSPPTRLRVEIMYGPGDGELRVVDGARGWRDGVAVSGPPLEAMQLQAARLELPLSLLQGEARVRDLGTAERDGVRVRQLELPLEGSLSVGVEIDVRTHRLVRSIGRSTGSTPLEFVTSYSDYRRVDGVLFAFSEKNLAMGRPSGDTVFDEFVTLLEAPSDSFGPVQ